MAPVLSVRGLTTVFGTGTHELRALDGVDLTVHAGEIVALVGESGSGKSLTGFSINGLLPGDARVTGGSVHLGDADLRSLTPRQMRQVRGRQVGMIFQDPMMTLNPVLRVETQMRDALRAHATLDKQAVRARLVAALSEVGIAAPEQRLRAWPHELSGGMRQRVAIATAMLHRPDLTTPSPLGKVIQDTLGNLSGLFDFFQTGWTLPAYLVPLGLGLVRLGFVSRLTTG